MCSALSILTESSLLGIVRFSPTRSLVFDVLVYRHGSRERRAKMCHFTTVTLLYF